MLKKFKKVKEKKITTMSNIEVVKRTLKIEPGGDIKVRINKPVKIKLDDEKKQS